MKRLPATLSAIAILGLLVLITSLARPTAAAGLATAPGTGGAQRTGYQAIDCTPGPNLILAGCVYNDLDISGSNFSGSNLTGATFNGANVSGSNFSGANLTEATFDGANLSCSNFNGAIFNATTLDGANLFGSTFEGATFIATTFGTTTTCPDGSTSGDNGGTCLNNLGSAGCGVVATSTPIPESTSTSTAVPVDTETSTAVPESTATSTTVPVSTETSTAVPGGGDATSTPTGGGGGGGDATSTPTGGGGDATSTPTGGGGGVPTIAPPGGSTPIPTETPDDDLETPTETSRQQTPGATVTGTPTSILSFPNTGAGPDQRGMNPTGQLLAIVAAIGILGGMASRFASRRTTVDSH